MKDIIKLTNNNQLVTMSSAVAHYFRKSHDEVLSMCKSLEKEYPECFILDENGDECAMTRKGFGILTTPFYKSKVQEWFLKVFYMVERFLRDNTINEKEDMRRACIESHGLYLAQYRKLLSNVDVKEMLRSDIEEFGFEESVSDNLYDLLMDIVTSVDNIEKIPTDITINDDVLSTVHRISDNLLTIEERRIVAKQPIVFKYHGKQYFEINDGHFNPSPEESIEEMMTSDDIYGLYELLDKMATELSDKRDFVDYVLKLYREPICYVQDIPVISVDDIVSMGDLKTKEDWLELIKKHEEEIDKIPFLNRTMYFVYDENGECYVTYQGCDYLSYDIEIQPVRDSFRRNCFFYFLDEDIHWYQINNPFLRTTRYIESEETSNNLSPLQSKQLEKEHFQEFLNAVRPMESEPNPTSIYIIKEEGKNFYKIGVARNVESRLKQIKTGNPNELTVIYQKEFPDGKTAYHLENKCHNIVKDKRIYSEWFELSKTDVDKLIHYLDKVNVDNEEQPK